MAEVGGITELQMLEAEIKLLEKQLDGVKRAEKASVACSRIVASIQAGEESDGFVGGSSSNQYHSSAGTAAEGGCCAVL